MLIYEVNVEVREDRATEYRAWLEEHIPAVVRAGGFTKATLFEPREPASPGYRALTTHYEIETDEALDRYIREHAPALRNDATKRFGDSFRATRRVLRSL